MTIHIVGFPVFIGGIARQLCAFCGEKLMDDDWNNIACFGGIGGIGGPIFWPIGQLLAVTKEGDRITQKTVVDYVETDPVPPESCAYVAPPAVPPKLSLVKS